MLYASDETQNTLSDDEIRLVRMLVRAQGHIAKMNAQDEMISEAERRSSASTHRLCAGLLAKLRTSEERLLEGTVAARLVGVTVG